MGTFRIAKRDNPFVQIDKYSIMDAALSFKAKGILAYLLSRPDDWQVYEAEIMKHASDGRSSVRAGIKELIEAGYIERAIKHGEKGRFAGYEYFVYERPYRVRFSDNGKSDIGESNTTNNESSNKELTDSKEHKTVKQVLPITLHTFSKDEDETVNQATAIVEFYYARYEQYTNKKHPKLKKDQLNRVYDEIMFYLDDGLDGQLWTDIVNQHLERSFKHGSNDLNINAFATERNLEIYFMREGIM